MNNNVENDVRLLNLSVQLTLTLGFQVASYIGRSKLALAAFLQPVCCIILNK